MDRAAGLKTRHPSPFLFVAPSKLALPVQKEGYRMDIFVGNLPSGITADSLRELFEPFGVVEVAHVARLRPGDESRRFGFVGMPVRSEGVCAVLGIHGRTIRGQTVTVAEIQPADPVSGSSHNRCRCRPDK